LWFHHELLKKQPHLKNSKFFLNECVPHSFVSRDTKEITRSRTNGIVNYWVLIFNNRRKVCIKSAYLSLWFSSKGFSRRHDNSTIVVHVLFLSHLLIYLHNQPQDLENLFLTCIWATLLTIVQ
jgi:hypothetical protein